MGQPAGQRGRGGDDPRAWIIGEVVYLAVTLAAGSVMLGWMLKKLDPNAGAEKAARARKAEIQRRLNRKIPPTNQYEDQIALDVVNPDHIEVGFGDVGGNLDAKRLLTQHFILPLRRPDLFSYQRGILAPSKGILLYGPPGTGKTMLAKAIARESGACFINVRASTLQSKWFGEAQRLTTAVFTLAAKIQPCIIFVDEIDSILGKRGGHGEHEATHTMKTEFMSLWDGLLSGAGAAGVKVLGATNRPYELDEAVLRRFSACIEVPLPAAPQRESILRVILSEPKGNVSPDARGGTQLARIAAATEGYSGSDLQELCTQAAMYPVLEEVAAEEAGRESGVPRSLEPRDLVKALDEVKPSGSAAVDYMLGGSRGVLGKLRGSVNDDMFREAMQAAMGGGGSGKDDLMENLAREQGPKGMGGMDLDEWKIAKIVQWAQKSKKSAQLLNRLNKKNSLWS